MDAKEAMFDQHKIFENPFSLGKSHAALNSSIFDIFVFTNSSRLKRSNLNTLPDYRVFKFGILSPAILHMRQGAWLSTFYIHAYSRKVKMSVRQYFAPTI